MDFTDNKPLCGALKKVLGLIYRYQFPALMKDVESIEEFKWELLKTDEWREDPFQNSQDVLEWLVNILSNENNEIKKLFFTEVVNQQYCRAIHTNIFLLNKPTIWLNNNLAISKQFEMQFNKREYASKKAGNVFTCSQCQQPMWIQEKNLIKQLPRILILNIGQQELVGGMFKKNKLEVPEELDLRDFVEKSYQEQTKYSLCSTIIHEGERKNDRVTMNAEFRAILKQNDSWTLCSKEGLRQVKRKEFEDDSCVLVYRQL